MKFQYTKHKAKWDRIIKHLQKGVKQYEEFSDLERVCCDDTNLISHSYACTYARCCAWCPLDIDGDACPAPIVDLAYDEGNFEYAIKIAKIIRDLPVKKGVDYE